MAVVMTVAVLYTAVTAGVCLFAKGAEGNRPGTRIVSLDVCGAGSVAYAAQFVDAALVVRHVTCPYFPVVSVIPPTPVKAVASADTGDEEKPPEA